jgi:opacity protein-like surface antigen
MRTTATVLLLVGVLLVLCCSSAMAQGNRSEFFGGGSVSYQSTVSGQNITDNPTYSAGYLVNYRYHFNDWAAVEVNYDHTRYTQFYSGGTGIVNSWTQANAKELTMAFVAHFWSRFDGRLRPFAEAGTGGMFWSPVAAGSVGGPFNQNRAVVLYGAGFDWKAFGHFGLRLGYRGLFFTAPDFNVNGQFTNARAQMREPYAGITFRF